MVALATALLVIAVDQWTKLLVVDHLGPPDQGPIVPLIGQYLVLYYIRNRGAAFSMFDTNGPLLVLLIVVAVAVIVYFYARMVNSGTLLYKLVFGLIIGGATGNLLDRFTHGSVVDFIWFRIPQNGFSFAIFNMADSAITLGVVLLFVALLFGGNGMRTGPASPDQPLAETSETVTPVQPVPSQGREHDA